MTGEPRRSYHVLRHVLVLSSAAAFLFAAGCGRSSESTAAATSTSTASTTTKTSTLSAEEAQVWEAYRAFWDAYSAFGRKDGAVEPFEKADFDHALGPHVTGPMYPHLLKEMSDGRALRQYFRGPPAEHDPRPEVTVTGEAAVVRDCMLDPGEIYDARRRVVIDPASGTRRLQIARLARVEGDWRVTEPLEGGEPCDA